jgi:hypothetical protein
MTKTWTFTLPAASNKTNITHVTYRLHAKPHRHATTLLVLASFGVKPVGWSSRPPFSVPTLVPLGKQAHIAVPPGTSVQCTSIASIKANEVGQ